MGALSPTHWLIIAGVLVLLFGAKRLPDSARSIGRSARILKAEVKEINPGPAATTADTAAVAPPAQAPAPQTAVPQTAAPQAPAPAGSTGDPAAAVTGQPAR